MSDYRIGVPIQLRFADTDALGHVNNANFLSYFEMARVAYFAEVMGNVIDWKERGIILARSEVDYRIPLFLEDKPIVKVRCSKIGNKSFVMSYRIEEGEKVYAEGNTVMVCFDFINNLPFAMPEEWKNKIEAFEGLGQNA
ncbi:MAG: acyl-CoA thioesterase [Flavobacteriales bacterium]|nr:acyl-CoA thioesterase [Flavobacteriales bacterium]